MGFSIDRCICFQRTFAELQEIAQNKGCHHLQELQRHVQFGEKCRLCHPYVRRMLRTQAIRFSEILTAADEPDLFEQE